ncbi:MAG: hypothetical protein FWF46_00780 [Oscillospiraceae bacterium]|nr:hypothetical protein [Oscillospiraceae bacterium]
MAKVTSLASYMGNSSNEVKRVYYKAIDEAINSKEYNKYVQKIDKIKDVLRHHTVSEKTIETLIECVEEKVAMEYEYVNKSLINGLSKK